MISIVKFESFEMFKKFLSDTKLTKQSEWLLAVGFLTRFAKKRFDLFQEYKKRSITANGVMEALEMHLAGQLENIPLCLKKKNGEEKMKYKLKFFCCTFSKVSSASWRGC